MENKSFNSILAMFIASYFMTTGFTYLFKSGFDNDIIILIMMAFLFITALSSIVLFWKSLKILFASRSRKRRKKNKKKK